MPMDERIVQELSRETQTDFHSDMLTHCRRLVDLSRARMHKYYDQWDNHDNVYRSVREVDKEDLKARNRKEPDKAIMPVTKSQVDTFVAFGFAVLFQKETFFALTPFGSDNARSADVGEQLLQRDLEESNIYDIVWQLLTDIGKFGLGIFKNTWVEEKQYVTEAVPPENREFFGVPVAGAAEGSSTTVQTKYQGNRIKSVSPYRFFPDPRHPIKELYEGEFVASEDEYSKTQLLKLEADGAVAGVKHVQTFSLGNLSESRKTSRLDSMDFSNATSESGPLQDGGTAVVTEVIIELVPSRWKLLDGLPIDEGDRPVKYIVWYANDNRVLRFERYAYAHDQYPYFVAQISPDNHHFINNGLAGEISKLQEIISWFVNSHITSVRKVIQNRLIVDPEGVEMEDLTEMRPVIRLKPGHSRSGVDRWIKQIDLTDVTAGHVQDAKALHDMVQIATGINDNALGQFHTGRRSAQEAKNVNSSVAARLKTVLSIIYYAAFRPLGLQMLSNLREGLSVPTFIRLFGLASDPQKFIEFSKATSSDLVGDYDFEVFDGTIPSERAAQAATLQESLAALLSSPDLILLTGLDVKEMFFELMRLKGIRHPERFQMGFKDRLALMQVITKGGQNGTNGETQSGGAGVSQPVKGGATPPPGSVDVASVLQGLLGGSGGQGANGGIQRPGGPSR